MNLYPLVLERRPSGGYGATFPDFPGCISGGVTVEDAFRNAHEAIELHVSGMKEDGEPMPTSTPYSQVNANTTFGDIVLLINVEP